MTTKILTVRVPSPLYATLCRDAGELGVPVSSHVRRLLEREHEVEQIDNLRRELLDRLEVLTGRTTTSHGEEVVLLCRAVAAHLNPQLVAQVRSRLALTEGARS